MKKNLIGTFANVLLGNNQFSGNIFGGGGSRFPDTTSYVAANNVIVKNLKTIGMSSHFGIMGNNNDNIKIECCSVADCQVADVYMQSVQGFVMENTDLSGSTTPVFVFQEQTQLVLMNQQYPQLIAAGVPGAAEHFAALQAYVAANPARFNPPPAQYPSSALYGLFMVPGPTAPYPFPMNAETVAASAALADGFRNGEYNANVRISNCKFSNFITSFDEIVAIGTNTSDPPSPVYPVATWPLIIFGLFGCIQWKDAFDTLGNFSPNAFLQALVFIMNYVYPSLGPAQGLVPTNSLLIFDSILNPDANKFFSNAAPIVSTQSDGTTAKGVFALRIIATKNAHLDHLKFHNVQSLGPAPIIPSTLPGYASVTLPQPVVRSRGNDAWFDSFEVCDNINYEYGKYKHIKSLHGYVFGIDLAGEDQNIKISKVNITDLSAPNTIETETMDLGDVFPFAVENEIGTIELKNVRTCDFEAGGEVLPFPSPSPTVILTNAIIC
jgi:hypothetical protein